MEKEIPSNVWNCRIDSSGRVVIPQSVRNDKGLKPGDDIAICKVGNEYVIRGSDETIQQLLAAFRASVPAGVDLVEELIAERRAEAKREEARY